MKSAKLERVWVLDVRSQKRYLGMETIIPTVNGKEMVSFNAEMLADTLKGLPDLSDKAVKFSQPQPAIGLFDSLTLKRVQKNFPVRGTSTQKRY